MTRFLGRMFHAAILGNFITALNLLSKSISRQIHCSLSQKREVPQVILHWVSENQLKLEPDTRGKMEEESSRLLSHNFKCPRKYGLFGIAGEVFPKLVNFLLDESVHTDKGANTVVSMLHYFLNNYGIGLCHLHLHADNGSGKNENSSMMWYLLWRVLIGRHRSITLSFLLTGHPKFSCD